MGSNDFAKELFDRFAGEKKTGELLPMGRDFYKQAESKTTAAPEDSEEVAKAKENISKTLMLLRSRRMQKILIYLAYNRRPPPQLAEDEETIYLQIKELLSVRKKKPGTARIKILHKIPEIINPKGGKTGPYEQNEIVECSAEEAAFLVANKIGEAMQ